MAFDPTTDAGPVNQTGDNDFYKKLAAALAAVSGGVAGRTLAGNAGDARNAAVPPQLSQMLDTAARRQSYQDPLFQATTQGVYSMLPTFAREGTALGSSLPPSSGAAGGGDSGGSMAGGLTGAGALGGLSALASMLSKGGGSNDSALASVFDAIKKRFGITDPTYGGLIQGDKPLPGGTGFPDVPMGGGGGGGDPTQPGGAQGQMFGIGLPFSSPWGGSGSPPTGYGGQQANYYDDPTRQSR